MSLGLNLNIARVQLLARKRQTVVAMLGVTFGIAMFILMISFMKGVNQFLQDLMMSTTADIRIYNKLNTDYSTSLAGRYFSDPAGKWIIVRHPKPKQVNLNIKNAPGIVNDLRKSDRILAVSPLLSSLVIFNYGPVQWAASVDGVDIMAEDKMFGLSAKMIAGRTDDLLRMDNGIIMGYKLAKDLNLAPGDLVTLTTQSGTQLRCRVVGLFKFGISTMDEFRAYINLASMQQLLGKDRDYITDIRIKLKDTREAKKLAAVYARKYGYTADDWEVVNASIKAGNTIRDTLTYVVSFTLLVVAGFGIYNIMNMVITNKLKDIAILKAQGFTGADIMQIFLSQSLIIGIAGGLLGLLLGFLLSFGMSRVPFPEDGYVSIKFFPVLFESQYYFFGMLFGILTTFLAGMLPALKAAKIDPVAILRG
ncbi:lipoprotein-releasing system permease protein [Chitinophaga rupis]|uniref:Lipoprotein-releasing system permease protein n=1 Tax=Chitinophaga rupis TaxID=573321 RepID=A0A1H7PVV3_9BACT|nr:ABC transporter permease [Chitinophaga rupis]SEL39970.1 lipoprotein-releasing system permease protein [Chitinophaga rupis]